MIGCSIRQVPGHSQEDAASVAIGANPVNAPAPAGLAQLGVRSPERIALLTSRYWGSRARTLKVRFLERLDPALAGRILAHMNAWHAGGASISFVQTTGKADVRVTLKDDGYWSYLGTDTKLIPQDQATLCLQDFSMSTSESEYRRVVRHETGHTLGFPHEHMRREVVARIDPQKAYAYFARWDGWDKQTVDEQVLTPLEDRQLFFTSGPDTLSIMCYQLPGSITKDGKPIPGGVDIDPADQIFANAIY